MIIQRKVSTWSWQATTIRRFADLAFHYLKFKKASKTSLIENKLKNKTTTKKNILERNILSMLESKRFFKKYILFFTVKIFCFAKNLPNIHNRKTVYQFPSCFEFWAWNSISALVFSTKIHFSKNNRHFTTIENHWSLYRYNLSFVTRVNPKNRRCNHNLSNKLFS